MMLQLMQQEARVQGIPKCPLGQSRICAFASVCVWDCGRDTVVKWCPLFSLHPFITSPPHCPNALYWCFSMKWSSIMTFTNELDSPCMDIYKPVFILAPLLGLWLTWDLDLKEPETVKNDTLWLDSLPQNVQRSFHLWLKVLLHSE